MQSKSVKIRYYSFAIVLVAITIAYLFMNVAYVKNIDGGIRGITAIFGGKETLEEVITLEFGVSYSGMTMMLFLGISAFLFIRSANEESNSLMGMCGGLLIACALLNYVLVTNLEVVGSFSVELGINSIAYFYSLICLGLGLLCFVYNESPKKQ